MLAVLCIMQPRIPLAILFCRDTLLAHVELGVNQNSHVLFCQAALQMGASQAVLVPGIVFSQVQNSPPLAKLHEVPVNLFLQPAEVPLESSMTLRT